MQKPYIPYITLHKGTTMDLASIPLFRTIALAEQATPTHADSAPLPPMRIVTDRPPLPHALWLNGMTPADAMAAHARLKTNYFCSCGRDGGGWFVRCDPDHYKLIN